MTEHTPGPWTWSKGDIGEDYSVLYSDIHAGDVTIASNVREEDGPLIAAAPDLLETLKEIAAGSTDPWAKEIAQRNVNKAEGRD